MSSYDGKGTRVPNLLEDYSPDGALPEHDR